MVALAWLPVPAQQTGDANRNYYINGQGGGLPSPVASVVANCGGCGNTCAIPNADAACVDGSCELSACQGNFNDCNDDPHGEHEPGQRQRPAHDQGDDDH